MTKKSNRRETLQRTGRAESRREDICEMGFRDRGGLRGRETGKLSGTAVDFIVSGILPEAFFISPRLGWGDRHGS